MRRRDAQGGRMWVIASEADRFRLLREGSLGMKRIVSVLVIIIILSALSPSSALGRVPDPDRWIWNANLGEEGGYIDAKCGTTAETLRVTLYEHNGYGGAAVRICGRVTDFCDVPMKDKNQWSVGCPVRMPQLFGPYYANDEISSVKGIWSGCAKLFERADFGGRSLNAIAWYSNLGPWDLNDKFSSVKPC